MHLKIQVASCEYGKPNCHLPPPFHLSDIQFYLSEINYGIQFYLNEIGAMKFTFYFT